ncbi:MAG TPA: hypothetical protein VGF59_01650 [Bryobacteraceae bacterium]|jgi:hypothetical protein
MADQHDVEVAIDILDELTTRLNGIIKSGAGFDNNSVMWLIKAWTKAGLRTRGPGFHRKESAYFVMSREPSPASGKRSLVLLSALEAYETMVEKHGITEGDYFQRADKAMLDFVWEYRKAVTGRTDRGKSERDFVAQLMQWMALSEDQVAKEVVTNMDRSL